VEEEARLQPAGVVPEEERIEGAKYLPRHVPRRLFDEQRFIFPESYGVNRVRLLVKDPEWLFAHWDLDPGVMSTLRRDIGERALALSRLTLRVSDASHGGSTVILLPSGARSWYVRADTAPRTYRAELGLTLPSGAFHRIAESNAVSTPRVGPSGERARRRVRWDRKGRHVAAAQSEPEPAGDEAASGPLPETRMVGGAKAPGGAATRRRSSRKGAGASDEHTPPGKRGGASDTYRR
jgi:hypothetical protein